MASKDEIEKAVMEKDKELRQKRIDTAVKFLQNPKVRQTPMSQRKAFMEKKGLKQDEIKEAIKVSGTAVDENMPPTPPPAPLRDSRISRSSQLQLSTVSPPPVPWKSYVGAAILGGGIGYTVAHLFKTFILPYVYYKKSKEEEKLEKIETSVAELKGNMTETVQRSLDSVQNLLEQQQKKLEHLALDLASTQSKVALLPSESYTVGDLKGEILSLKGLLLNRKQFPLPVVGSTPAAPSIPSWQRTVPTSGGRTRTTSSLTDSETPGPSQNMELAESGARSASKITSLEYSSINGDVTKDSEDSRTETTENQELASSKESPAGTGSTSSSSGTDTGHTIKTVVSAEEASLNDAMLNDTSILSSDTSLSSMSDLSGNTSFHEASIAFSSTCIKVPSDTAIPSDSTVEFDEGGDFSGGVVEVQ